MLEDYDFDVVVACLDLEKGAAHYLIDDLRQRCVLNPRTVVVYVTSRPTYARVLEASQSSMDGVVVRPLSPKILIDKVRLALTRNESLADLFQAVQAGDLDSVHDLAVKRQRQGAHSKYCARLAVELLLQAGRGNDVHTLLGGLNEDGPVAWVELALARSDALAGRRTGAKKRLDDLLLAEPTCADAYELLGQMAAEDGDLKQAMESYMLAAEMTPGCLIRIQHAGALAFFAGDKAAARALLVRAKSLGGDSRLYDGVSLFLLGLLDSDLAANTALRTTAQQLGALAATHPKSFRLQHLRRALGIVVEFRSSGDVVRSSSALMRLASEAYEHPDFTAETAMAVAAAGTRVRAQGAPLGQELLAWLDKVGLRLCTGRPVMAYLGAATGNAPEALSLFQYCHDRVMAHAQAAVDACHARHFEPGIRSLFEVATATKNSRLLDLCARLAKQHAGALGPQAQYISTFTSDLSRRCTPAALAIAGVARTHRAPGGLVMARKKREPVTPVEGVPALWAGSR